MIITIKTSRRVYVSMSCSEACLADFHFRSNDAIHKILASLGDRTFQIYANHQGDYFALPEDLAKVDLFIRFSKTDSGDFCLNEFGGLADLDPEMAIFPVKDAIGSASGQEVSYIFKVHGFVVVGTIRQQRKMRGIKQNSEVVAFYSGSAIVPADLSVHPYVYVLGQESGFVDYAQMLNDPDVPLFAELRQGLDWPTDDHVFLNLQMQDGSVQSALVNVSDLGDSARSLDLGAKTFAFQKSFGVTDVYSYRDDHASLVVTKGAKADYRLFDIAEDPWLRAPAFFYLNETTEPVKMELGAEFFDGVIGRPSFHGSFEAFLERKCLPSKLATVVDAKSFLEPYQPRSSFPKKSDMVFDQERCLLAFTYSKELYRLRMTQKTGKHADEFFYDGSKSLRLPSWQHIPLSIFGTEYSLRAVDPLDFDSSVSEPREAMYFKVHSNVCYKNSKGVLFFKGGDCAYLVHVSMGVSKKSFWPIMFKSYSLGDFELSRCLSEFKQDCGIEEQLHYEEFSTWSCHEFFRDNVSFENNRSITTYAYVGKNDHYVALRYRDEELNYTYYKYRFDNIDSIPKSYRKAALEALAIRHFLIRNLSGGQDIFIGSQKLHLSVSSARLEKALRDSYFEDFSAFGLWHIIRYVATRCYASPIICRNEPMAFEAKDIQFLRVPDDIRKTEADEAIHIGDKNYFVTRHAVMRSQERMTGERSHSGWGFVAKYLIRSYATEAARQQIRVLVEGDSALHITPDRWAFAFEFADDDFVILKTFFQRINKFNYTAKQSLRGGSQVG